MQGPRFAGSALDLLVLAGPKQLLAFAAILGSHDGGNNLQLYLCLLK